MLSPRFENSVRELSRNKRLTSQREAVIKQRMALQEQADRVEHPVTTSTCHCGAVAVEVPEPPDQVSDCNCSICRRYGALWAYYPASSVTVRAAPGATEGYAWGEKTLRFVRCVTCGCVTHWERIEPVAGSKMGVNARLFAPEVLAGVPVEKLDGAAN